MHPIFAKRNKVALLAPQPTFKDLKKNKLEDRKCVLDLIENSTAVFLKQEWRNTRYKYKRQQEGN